MSTPESAGGKEWGGNGASEPPPPKRHINAIGMRSDVGGKHCISIDGDPRRILCK